MGLTSRERYNYDMHPCSVLAMKISLGVWRKEIAFRTSNKSRHELKRRSLVAGNVTMSSIWVNNEGSSPYSSLL